MTSHSFSFQGESGLGKSTLINSLFLTDLYPERVIPGAAGTEGPAPQWQRGEVGAAERSQGPVPRPCCSLWLWTQGTAVGQGKGRCPRRACMAGGPSFPRLIVLSTGCDSSCLYYVFDEDQVKMVAHEKTCIQRKFLWAWVSSDPFPLGVCVQH